MRVSRDVLEGDFRDVPPPDRDVVPQFEGRVRQELIGEARGISVSLVHFYDGARTYPHSHADGQILIVLNDRAQVWTEHDGVIDLEAGDVVHAAPGELHWHGAAPGHTMTHMSIAAGSSFWPNSPFPPRADYPE